MIVFGSLDPETLSRVVAQKLIVEDLFVNALVENKDFILSLLYGTGSAESSNARIVALNNLVKEASNA